jgi:hypothetical protein
MLSGAYVRTRFLTLLLAGVPAVLAAQGEPPSQTLPREVQREVVDRWNGTNALRASDRLDIGVGHDVLGNVAVQNGPLTVAGHVTGGVLAINSDVILLPTARIDGELLVVGGEVDGRTIARVDGGIRIYRARMHYRDDGDKIVASDEPSPEESWWRRFEHGPLDNHGEALRVVQAGPYNRVEGLPIELGPVVQQRTSWGSVRFDAAAVIRTASTFNAQDGDVGDKLRGEVRIGHERGIGLGVQGRSIVQPVEDWQLSDIEVALAAFLARRDYRDYYQRKGGNAFVTLYGARNVSLTGSYGEERWSSRPAHNAFTLFNEDVAWRPNPRVDEGLFHVGNLALTLDTRSDPDDPSAGWFVNTNVEHGRGDVTSMAPTSTARADLTGSVTDYTRGYFDFRRYNRLGPASELNMRIVLAGWLGGDALPLERRLSVGGPGSLPGFGFRADENGPDIGTCSVSPAVSGRPAECERIALAQLEYRGDLSFDFASNWASWPRRYHSAHGDVQWVFFADAGRGWNVGPSDGVMTFNSETLPSLSSFRTDLGIGLDFAGIGIYAAKAVSRPDPVNFFVRLRHQF